MDIIETIRDSVIQHGPHNNRIYLMRLNTENAQSLIRKLDRLAVKNGYGKIFAKIPASEWDAFKSAGYLKEAVIPGFFSGRTDGCFVAKYFSADRKEASDIEVLQRVVESEGKNPGFPNTRIGGENLKVTVCRESDAAEMAEVYRKVFKSYPFPIEEPNYLKRLLNENVLYYCIRVEGRIAAIACADIDRESKTVEMTDFATLPNRRKKGFAGMLLEFMDGKVRKLGVKTAYTIARASSYGMNAVFKKSGYQYAGLLRNNSHICGSIQSMAVWYKHL